MDLLNGIIGGGPVNVDVTVNGQPLSSLVTQLATALQSHTNQLEELRNYTYSTDEKMWNRISTLEDGVSRINRDLGFEQRAAADASGAAAAGRTTHDRVTGLETDVATLNRKRQGAAAATALEHTKLAHMRMRYHTWINLTRRNVALREMLGGNSKDTQRRFYRKWQMAVRLIRLKRGQARGVEAVQQINARRQMRHCYDTWRRFREFSLEYRAQRHVALVRAVEAMRAVTVRGFMRRKWLQWMGLVARRRLREDQTKAALRMAAVSSRSLVRRYFSVWVNVEGQHNLRRRQLRTATALAVQSARVLAGRAFSKWVRAGQRKHQRRMGAALVPRMAHEASVRLAGRYYTKLWRNAVNQRDERARKQLEDMTRDLTRRFETLSGQVAGTMNKTDETVTALQKLSHQQQQLERQATQNTSGGVRQPTPPGRRQSPNVAARSGSSTNLQALAAATSPPPASSGGAGGGLAASAATLRQHEHQHQQPTSRTSGPPSRGPASKPSSAVQSGVDHPSSSAMQLGTHVSQVTMRGGGSGEVSRVSGAGGGGGGGVRGSAASTTSRSGSTRQDTQQLPQQWLDNPADAWGAMRDRLQQQPPQPKR